MLHILVEVKMGIYQDVNGDEVHLFEFCEDYLTGEDMAVFRTLNRTSYSDNGIVHTCKYSDFKKMFKFVRSVDELK